MSVEAGLRPSERLPLTSPATPSAAISPMPNIEATPRKNLIPKITIPSPIQETNPVSMPGTFNGPEWTKIFPAQERPTIEYGDLIPRPENRVVPSLSWVTTGEHELRHVRLAKMHGVRVTGVSVEPQGMSLGRTTFEGDFFENPEAFMIIAAGGAAKIEGGTASGYGSASTHGSDMYYVNMLAPHARIRAQDALSIATHNLRGISHAENKRAAEILASMGSIHSEAVIERVLEVAALEIKHGVTANLTIDEALNEKYATNEPSFTPAAGKYTVIEQLPDGQTITVLVLIKKDLTQVHLCTYCKGENGHASFCPITKKGETESFTSSLESNQ